MTHPTDPQSADQQFFAALTSANVQALDDLLSDDFVLIDVMQGSQITKAQLMEVVGSGVLTFTSIEAAEVRVRTYGPVALVTGRTAMGGQYGETPWSVQSRYTHVYVQQEGGWRMVNAQGTGIVD